MLNEIKSVFIVKDIKELSSENMINDSKNNLLPTNTFLLPKSPQDSLLLIPTFYVSKFIKTDSLRCFYCSIISEFFASLIYTLFCK